MTHVLELSRVTRCYEAGIDVLVDVSLTLDPGEVVGLLGENGAGKTTLIQIALGMLTPQAGKVRLFGFDPQAFPVRVKRRLGYVSEDQVLPPYLTVEGVLEMHRALFPTWDRALEAQLAERFDIGGREKVGKLSKGQARRVAVLCAIAHRPELLLLDEPAGGLDPAARREFLETAVQFLAAEGSTILFSSHQMEDVERIASRVCLLHDRGVLIDRDLDELRETTVLASLPSASGADDLRGLTGCLASRVVGGELRGVFIEGAESVRGQIGGLSGAQHARITPISLEDLFIEIAEGRR
ncbi:ABC transporter ATP-binding protein [Engelhardtia mirabilis]|uniref:ABC transporter ATP-binding protein YtrB n=1 Tax=Engelhardtia mirabilis TaxID=2528011 RepID=A0A518BE37_9BACT|nr:ABC transporter ATP-binding protein YtrB [Planctomycetes bacterium Pla133]QDU99573.1 ABC transporter ATP-binding protein YtrB [Planctomycetes bacterium Pla86]